MHLFLEEEIKNLLWKSQSKKNVCRTSATDSQREELHHLPNNLPSGDRRKRTLLACSRIAAWQHSQQVSTWFFFQRMLAFPVKTTHFKYLQENFYGK